MKKIFVTIWDDQPEPARRFKVGDLVQHTPESPDYGRYLSAGKIVEVPESRVCDYMVVWPPYPTPMPEYDDWIEAAQS